MLDLILHYLPILLFYKWLLSWGGAEKLDDWLSHPWLSWLNSDDWDIEQVRFYALIMFIGYTFIFIIFFIIELKNYFEFLQPSYLKRKTQWV